MMDSVTRKNSRTSQISDTLQSARLVLQKENIAIDFSSDETRRIILLCILHVISLANKNAKPSLLSEILDMAHLWPIYDVWIGDRNFASSIHVTNTMGCIDKLMDYTDWQDYLDYSCEALEYDVSEYFSVSIKRGVRSENSKKKKQGIYYTPKDVVDFMVSKCLDNLKINDHFHECSFLDCSCGAAAFLLAVFKRIEKALNPDHKLDKALYLFDVCIWGVDKSAIAIDNSIFVFLKYFILNHDYVVDRIEEVWQVVRNSFIVGDATLLDKIIQENNQLPSLFDCIIGNPPYVTLSKHTNLFIKFVQNLMNFSSDSSCSALVLPLSICYSQGSDFISLRERIMDDNACWEFHNYDRSPDSLFGDQVKTRNTIVIRNNTQSKKGLFTTGLQRWSSEYRDLLFKNIRMCDISDVSIRKHIPKISAIDNGKKAYMAFANGEHSLANMKASANPNEYMVLNGTAYNWLCSYDHFPNSLDENGELFRSNTCSIHHFDDSDTKYFCIALLSNRFAYWYWTVISDGFHLNASFLADCHIKRNEFTKEQFHSISELGRLYCERIRAYPTVSHNAGKTIINYSHEKAMDIVVQIERIIKEALDLPEGFCSEIDTWYINHISCNR